MRADQHDALCSDREAFGILGVVFAEPLVGLVVPDAQVAALAVPYIRVTLLATVLFVALYWLHRSGRSETGSGHGGHEGSHATDD